MNSAALATQTYELARTVTADLRTQEYRVFAETSRALASAASNHVAAQGAAATIRAARHEENAQHEHGDGSAIGLAKSTVTAAYAALAEALHQNQRLWASVAIDVAMPENGLPEELRARLFWLADFVRLHTPEVLSGSASADALVDINTAVMRGLAHRPETG